MDIPAAKIEALQTGPLQNNDDFLEKGCNDLD
jgi:hypothetical protein